MRRSEKEFVERQNLNNSLLWYIPNCNLYWRTPLGDDNGKLVVTVVVPGSGNRESYLDNKWCLKLNLKDKNGQPVWCISISQENQSWNDLDISPLLVMVLNIARWKLWRSLILSSFVLCTKIPVGGVVLNVNARLQQVWGILTIPRFQSKLFRPVKHLHIGYCPSTSFDYQSLSIHILQAKIIFPWTFNPYMTSKCIVHCCLCAHFEICDYSLVCTVT